MDPIDVGAAAVVTGYLVALYKLAVPATNSLALVLVAVVGGIASAALITLASGTALDLQIGAQTVIHGVGAAAIAAGLTRTDSAAEARREE